MLHYETDCDNGAIISQTDGKVELTDMLIKHL